MKVLRVAVHSSDQDVREKVWEVLRKTGMRPAPQADCEVVRLNKAQVEVLELHLENSVLMHDPESEEHVFWMIPLRVDSFEEGVHTLNCDVAHALLEGVTVPGNPLIKAEAQDFLVWPHNEKEEEA